MRIIIIEDEPPIAEYIEVKIAEILKEKKSVIDIANTYDEAVKLIENGNYDLCFLDINLHGKEGFGIIEHFASMQLPTIIISAHTEKAIKAYEYGVIDFVPKPFNAERLNLAIQRYYGHVKRNNMTKYIVYRKQNKKYLLPIDQIIYFEADSYIVNAHLKDGSVKILESSLKRLEKIVPENYLRVHKSFLVNISMIESYFNSGGGVYKIKLKNGEQISLSRNGVKILAALLKIKEKS